MTPNVNEAFIVHCSFSLFPESYSNYVLAPTQNSLCLVQLQREGYRVLGSDPLGGSSISNCTWTKACPPYRPTQK